MVIELLATLEHLPLAITQAAAYIIENDISFADYLDILSRSDSDLVDLLNQDLQDHRRYFDSSNSVIRTWKISFDQIRRQKPRAAQILSLLSVLDGQGVPEVLLRNDDDTVADFVTSIGILKAFSLITTETGGTTFEVHRLVHLATQMWLRMSGELASWQQKALGRVAAIFLIGVYENWEICAALAPHVEVVLGYDKPEPSSRYLLARGQLLYNSGDYDEGQGRHDLAYTKLAEALAISEEVMGADDPETLTICTMLCLLLWQRRELQAAESMCRRAVDGTQSYRASMLLRL